MSEYSMTVLNESVAVGLDKAAWHFRGIDLAALRASGNFYSGPVPLERALELVGWEPEVISLPDIMNELTSLRSMLAPGDDAPTAYEVPDRMSKVIGRRLPTGVVRIINNVGGGYAENLHNVLREAVYAAMDAECDVASAVCLNDGDYLGLSLIARDAVTLGGDFGTLQPYVSINSSLTSKIGTGASTGTTRFECDNTMQAGWSGARRRLNVKRTRNAATKITPQLIRESLEIAFAETTALAADLERLGNISVSDAQLAAVLDAWRPLDAEEGRGRTMSENTRNAFEKLLTYDPRVNVGQNAAGLWQAHNTWQHWEQTAKGGNAQNRIGRQMQRTAEGEVSALDAEFMALVAGVIPAVGEALGIEPVLVGAGGRSKSGETIIG